MRFSVAVVLLCIVHRTAGSTQGVDGVCQKFCTRALSLCKGHDAPFDNMTECLTSCPKFATAEITPYRDIVGTGRDVGSLPCRELWLDRVEKQLKENGFIYPGTCDYVTGSGGGMCDASVPHNCEHYCFQLEGEGDCGTGPWNPPHHDTCMEACSKFRNGTTDSLRGNTLQCRLYYINVGEQSVYPNAKPEYCPYAGIASKMCKDDPANDQVLTQCTDYCSWNEKFCNSKEGTPQCLTYCQGLTAEVRACHLKYVAVAGRCTVPEVPCYHREVCGKPGMGFETAPNVKRDKPEWMVTQDGEKPIHMVNAGDAEAKEMTADDPEEDAARREVEAMEREVGIVGDASEHQGHTEL